MLRACIVLRQRHTLINSSRRLTIVCVHPHALARRAPHATGVFLHRNQQHTRARVEMFGWEEPSDGSIVAWRGDYVQSKVFYLRFFCESMDQQIR